LDEIAMPEKKTFVISRAGADKRWAELIASVVRDAGHEAIYQDEHYRVGQSFIDNMMRATEADCTIAILSPAYFASEYCLAELNAALADDPLGRRGRIVPVRVETVAIPSLLGQLAYLDLVGADGDSARQRLMMTLVRHGQVDPNSVVTDVQRVSGTDLGLFGTSLGQNKRCQEPIWGFLGRPWGRSVDSRPICRTIRSVH
jgi:hypothetical protein